MKAAEKTLFLSLWAVLLLGVLIWRFWPHQPEAALVGPNVNFRKEISLWFAKGTVVSAGATQYTVELQLSPDFLETLSLEGRQFHLGYHFIVEAGEKAGGMVPCRVQRDRSSVQLLLPNPRGVVAREIELSLAH